MDRYLPIAEHGLIGDLHTAALIGVDGTIDWYCCPDFDSPSVFAAILDHDRGGFWRIAPTGGGWTSKQLYFPDTNILITRFLSPDGVGEVQDFMPIAGSPARPPHSLIRRLVCVRGEVEFETVVEPRFDYGRVEHELRPHERGAIFESPALTLALASPRPLTVTGAGARTAFTLSHGESASFALVPPGRGEEPPPFDEQAASLALTVEYLIDHRRDASPASEPDPVPPGAGVEYPYLTYRTPEQITTRARLCAGLRRCQRTAVTETWGVAVQWTNTWL